MVQLKNEICEKAESVTCWEYVQ